MAQENYYLKVSLAIFIVLFLGLGVGLYFVCGEWSKASQQAAQSDTAAKDANTKLAEKTREAISLREMIGVTDTDAMDVVTTAFTGDTDFALKGQRGVPANYRRMVAFLAKQFTDKNDELVKLQANYNTLETNFHNLNELSAAINGEHDKNLQKTVADLVAARDEYTKNIAAQKGEYDASVKRMEGERDEAISASKSAINTKDASDKEKDRVMAVNKTLAAELANLRSPVIERPDGKIIAVSQERGIVSLNLGSDDGLLVRMVFTVYDPSVLGITLPRKSASDYGDDSRVCTVCKRQEQLDIAKASVEVIRITGPHTAEARILDDHLGNPIMNGDIVYTPVWKPGQKQRFAITAGVSLSGNANLSDPDQQREGLQAVINLIKSNGGEVDAWVDEKDELQGTMTQETTFIVIGSGKSKVVEGMLSDADNLAIRKIPLSELIRMMGYKDVTPVRGYGKNIQGGDHSVKPDIVGRAAANGNVSSVYQRDNIGARIGVAERPLPVSTGNVSGLYTAPPSPPGSVSDLFRPRTPPTE